ncbi:hypothetical protein [Lonsdalea quercina]|uniref:hypothetical protein n=1 Tax=Lonsdalea quercina TaxID=71657 RepID=UPI003975B92B
MISGSAVIDLTLALLAAAELLPAIRIKTVAPTGPPTTFWRTQPAESVEQTRQRFADLISQGRTTEI